MYTLTQVLIAVALLASIVFALPPTEGGIVDAKEINLPTDKFRSDISDRLQGGKRAAPGQFPHQVLLRLTVNGIELGHGCSGTIITDRFVLTAARCQYTPEPHHYHLVVGTNKKNYINGTVYNVTRWIMHEDYYRNETKQNWTIRNDIALIESATTIKFGKLVAPIALESGFINEARAVVAGWGYSKVCETTNFNIPLNRLKLTNRVRSLEIRLPRCAYIE